MCGIAGTINFNGNACEAIKQALYHRGPNEQFIYSYENINLIHTRLSIQDISHGHQPFHFQEYSIVFNGEIYNHMELRKKLQGFIFQTHSDTETLLYMFIKYGEKMFSMIDGMFAFCILNKKEKKLFLARDRAGKKPLYIYKKDNKLLFASELNAIKSSVELKVNEEYISSYLRTGFFYKKYTPYRDVIEAEAGYFYYIDINTLQIESKQYFNMFDFYQKKSLLSFEESVNKVDSLLHKSVKDRLLSSDLEVGAFLSGGIDSSLVVAIASEYTNKLKTFTVKFDGTFDESNLAKLTANKYNTNHQEISISMNLKNDIEKILYNYGEPFMDSSAIPSYYVSQEAKKHVTVILNGDGADELFGGYRRYVPIANGWLNIASKFTFLLKMIPNPHNKQSLYNYFYRLLSMSKKKGLNFYLSATNDIFEDIYLFDKNRIFGEMDEFINDIHKTNLTPLSKQLYLDFSLILFSDLLVKMDIATMSHSLEGRSPFLSRYMLEFVPTLQDQYKVNGKNTKFILRELAKKYLSKELLNQPKRGFEVPLKLWVEKDLKENIFDILDTNCYSYKFIDKQFIENLLNKKISVSDEKRAKMLWTLYSLEIWNKNK
ncbi:MAG: asparagine synthase (glutamine-hydrolyzing) [Arcobacteraceae bacterium]|nr:asparagine synthase (glutamine-hydrolyzing) [Arcobacteraceae bacterium]